MKLEPNADFVKWLKDHEQLDYEKAKYCIEWISDAHNAWQACQRLNDARITSLESHNRELLAVNQVLRDRSDALLLQLKDMVSTYRYEASMENEALLETIVIINKIDPDYDAWD